MLRVSWPKYLSDPLQQLPSPSTSDDRSRSHRCLLWSTQDEHLIRQCIVIRHVFVWRAPISWSRHTIQILCCVRSRLTVIQFSLPWTLLVITSWTYSVLLCLSLDYCHQDQVKVWYKNKFLSNLNLTYRPQFLQERLNSHKNIYSSFRKYNFYFNYVNH